MLGRSDRISAEFFAWEARGRGFALYEYPVELEPTFTPYGLTNKAMEVQDEGRRPTLLSSLVRRFSERLAPSPADPAKTPQEDETPRPYVRQAMVELSLHLPESGQRDRGMRTEFLESLVLHEPAALEIVGIPGSLSLVFTIHPQDEAIFRKQLAVFYPDCALARRENYLEGIWGAGGDGETGIVEFGLGKEFVIPFEQKGSDPYIALTAALSEVREGEIAAYQVLFTPALSSWNTSIAWCVSRYDEGGLFVNAPELLSGAQRKQGSRLWAVVVRIAVKSPHPDRVWEIACNVAGAIGAYGSSAGNHLIPLKNEGYDRDAHEEDFLSRQSRRSGMIVNSQEIALFAHVPGPDVSHPALRSATKSKAAPKRLVADGVVIGVNEHLGTEAEVVLSDDERMRHTHVIGASGCGKSSLLYSMAMQDIKRGKGITVLDPHGDLIDRLLGSIPEDRIEDVVLLDPSDETHVVGFNILSAKSAWEKNLLASDLVAVFRRFSSSWGDQLNSVLQNAVLAFLESGRGGTLVDLRRFLLEPDFRRDFLLSVKDKNVVYYWAKAFPQLTGGKSIGPVITRLDAFLSPRPIRSMVAQAKGALDIGEILNEGRIFLARLPRGRIGEENSHLIGSLLVAKIQAEAMARQDRGESERRDHFLYIDEFPDFITPSLAGCLSGVRKYRLGMVLGHQEMRQAERDPDVASALLANAHTRIVFRVGDKDARTLEGGFSSFDAKDIQRLSTGHAICRIERSDQDFNLRTELPTYPSKEESASKRRRVIEASRKWCTAPDAEPPPPAPIPRDDEPPPMEVAPPMPTPPAPATIAPPAPLVELGKGGAQHTEIQQRVKDGAEALGYRAVIEKPVAGGSVDLVLSRDGVEIACEITITNTIDYEVRNVSKCLKAGFTWIAVVSASEEKLGKLSGAVFNTFGAEKAALVRFFLPDAFLAFLAALPPSVEKAEPPPRSRGGRVVKRKFTAVSAEEAKSKESDALRLMAEMMKKAGSKK